MELSSDTALKVHTAWARLLGVPLDSLRAENGKRVYSERTDHPVLMYVSLFGVGVVIGPEWAIEAARDLTDQELASHSQLLEISAPHDGQPLGEAGLYFCDSVPRVPGFTAPVSRDREHAAALERDCSPDDAAEVGLSDMTNTFVLMGDEGAAPRPLAGSGYDIWEDSLAHMGVLTAQGERRRGHAALAVSIAMEEAMRSGLVPQWRARTDNTASIRTALRAGFKHAGSQTTVLLNASG